MHQVPPLPVLPFTRILIWNLPPPPRSHFTIFHSQSRALAPSFSHLLARALPFPRLSLAFKEPFLVRGGRGSQIHSRFARLGSVVFLPRSPEICVFYSFLLTRYAHSYDPFCRERRAASSLSLSFSPFLYSTARSPLFPLFEVLVYSRSSSNLLANFHFYLWVSLFFYSLTAFRIWMSFHRVIYISGVLSFQSFALIIFVLQSFLLSWLSKCINNWQFKVVFVLKTTIIKRINLHNVLKDKKK